MKNPDISVTKPTRSEAFAEVRKKLLKLLGRSKIRTLRFEEKPGVNNHTVDVYITYRS